MMSRFYASCERTFARIFYRSDESESVFFLWMVFLLTFFNSLLGARGDVNYIIATNNQGTNALRLSINYLFCFVKHKIHVDVIPLENSLNFPAPFYGNQYWLAVQDLI